MALSWRTELWECEKCYASLNTSKQWFLRIAGPQINSQCRQIDCLNFLDQQITPLKTNMTLENLYVQLEIHRLKWWILQPVMFVFFFGQGGYLTLLPVRECHKPAASNLCWNVPTTSSRDLFFYCTGTRTKTSITSPNKDKHILLEVNMHLYIIYIFSACLRCDSFVHSELESFSELLGWLQSHVPRPTMPAPFGVRSTSRYTSKL